MKIGEIAIITHNSQNSENFIKSICKNLDVNNGIVSFGHFVANDELGLHFYGFNLEKEERSLSWDLIIRKMIGYIFIFDWEDQISFETIRPILDRLTVSVVAPIVVVANFQKLAKPPLPHVFYIDSGIHLSANCRFTYGQVNQQYSAKKIMVLLIDMLLQQAST
jgi:signal recognition particle receptor subunit beta